MNRREYIQSAASTTLLPTLPSLDLDQSDDQDEEDDVEYNLMAGNGITTVNYSIIDRELVLNSKCSVCHQEASEYVILYDFEPRDVEMQPTFDASDACVHKGLRAVRAVRNGYTVVSDHSVVIFWH